MSFSSDPQYVRSKTGTFETSSRGSTQKDNESTQTDNGSTQTDRIPTATAAQFLVLFFFVVCGQALMSWDGGATKMSQQTLAEDGWSSGMLGWLGAMDKIGQTLCAPFWGPILDGSCVKWLIFAGLVLKALSSAAFGFFSDQFIMMASKFGMGAFEALVGIWCMNWIQKNGPTDAAKGTWQGNQGIAAGIGDGIGSLIAGLCSSVILGSLKGYSLAFLIQAGLLAALSLCMFFTPRQLLELQNSKTSPLLLEQSPDSKKDSKSVSAEACDILSNKLWRFTLLSMSCCVFVQTGIAYMWQLTTLWVWNFDSKLQTISLLLINALGGFLGTQLGPRLIAKYIADYCKPSGTAKCLRAFTHVTLATSLTGSACALLLLQKVWHILHYDVPQQEWGWLLTGVLFFVFLIMVFMQSLMGTLTVIMINSVPAQAQGTAVGFGQAIQNILGYACGMILPTQLAGFVAGFLRESRAEVVKNGAINATGMALPFFATWLLHLCMILAARAAERRAESASSGLNAK